MKDINFQLAVLRAFQQKYPKSHVGGSIGLHLLGVDLKRDLWFSDLDITTPEFTEKNNDNLQHSSAVEDFDHAYQINENKTGKFFKLEIRIDDEQSDFDVVNFEGFNYNVTKKETILKWKLNYALKGVEKHIHDLFAIATGVRPKKLENELPY